MNIKDKELTAALYDWRKSEATKKFKGSIVRQLGAKVLMAEEIVVRVVECARAGKLVDVKSLKLETSWKYAEECGESLLSVIRVYFPAPPADQGATGSNPKPVAGAGKCSKCGQTGHNSKLYFYQPFS